MFSYICVYLAFYLNANYRNYFASLENSEKSYISEQYNIINGILFIFSYQNVKEYCLFQEKKAFLFKNTTIHSKRRVMTLEISLC